MNRPTERCCFFIVATSIPVVGKKQSIHSGFDDIADLRLGRARSWAFAGRSRCGKESLPT